MKQAQLLIKNAAIFLHETGGLIHGDILVHDGKVAALSSVPITEAVKTVLDADGLLLLPGGIDPHVHIRDPGNRERETFETGTQAAAQGGVTTVIEHPISNPPQYNPEILQRRIDAASEQAYVDFGFVGAAGGEYLDEIRKMGKERILGFKTFLHAPPNGRDAEFRGLTMKDDYELYTGLQAVAQTGLRCLVHAEDDDLIQGLTADLRKKGRLDPLAHEEGRPALAEVASVCRVMEFAKATGAKVEFCHISTPQAVRAILRERKNGYPFLIETCPHYLFLNTETLKALGPYAKCNPPLRDPALAEELWNYIEDGTIDFVGSDHAPFLVEEKESGREDIFKAMSGFPGLDLRGPLMLTQVAKGRLSLKRCVELLSVNPAKAFGIYPQKGTISVGSDADFVLVDMRQEFEVRREDMLTKSRDTALVYEGWKLTGRPVYTIVRGSIVWENGKIHTECRGTGRLVTRRST